jgi:hypothetical protein
MQKLIPLIRLAHLDWRAGRTGFYLIDITGFDLFMMTLFLCGTMVFCSLLIIEAVKERKR